MVHHKFCIVDDRVVITGSYNWTYNAENRNWENIVVLEDKETVNDYIQEFENVISNHKRIVSVVADQQFDSTINSNEYLQSDYIFQAKQEEKKGNDLAAAKIYNEILRIKEIEKVRTLIASKTAISTFKVCPFEIGILFQEGYKMVIPALSPLPFFSPGIVGCSPIDNPPFFGNYYSEM